MITSRLDQDTLTKLFSEAATWQAEIWRQAVCKGTLQALRGRASTLASMRKLLTTVVPASSEAAQGPLADFDFEALLSKVFAGMDTTLLQAVQANRRALLLFAEQGADQTALRDGRAIGLRAPQAVIEGCIALVSGVLVGVAEGLQPETAAASGRAPRRRG